MDHFDQLMAAAQEALRGAPDAAQVLAIQSQDGRISVFPNDLSAEKEEGLLSAQAGPIAALLCVWANGQLDVPSFRVRKGLLQADPGNEKALVFLQGEAGVCPKPLSQTL